MTYQRITPRSIIPTTPRARGSSGIENGERKDGTEEFLGGSDDFVHIFGGSVGVGIWDWVCCGEAC